VHRTHTRALLTAADGRRCDLVQSAVLMPDGEVSVAPPQIVFDGDPTFVLDFVHATQLGAAIEHVKIVSLP
jgi:hypothetical protein